MKVAKYLANENFPVSSFRLLKSIGWDIIYIGEAHLGLLDSEVMEMAIREARIITFDRDYGELVYRFGYNPPGVIYLRLKNFTPEEPAELLRKIDIKGEFTFEGFFTVISPNEIRQRKIT